MSVSFEEMKVEFCFSLSWKSRWDSWELIYFRACLKFGLKLFES